MTEYKNIKLSKGFTITIIKTDKFKNTTLNLFLASPNKSMENGTKALLVDLLTNSTKNYPSVKSFSKYKEEMYGMLSGGSHISYGEVSVIKLATSAIHSRYLKDKVDLLENQFQLLNEMLNYPLMEKERFEESYFKERKRNYLTLISSFNDDKEYVAISNSKKCLCEDHPFSTLSMGTVDEINKVTNAKVSKIYEKLFTYQANLFVVGDVNEEQVIKLVKEYFQTELSNKLLLEPVVLIPPAQQKEVVETKDTTQSQLVMHFNTQIAIDGYLYYPSIVFNSLLGGLPISKLFNEVREKLSLCYSISSYYAQLYGIISISAGIDANNYELATSVINQQIEAIAQGEFTEREMDNCKRLVIESYLRQYDSVNSIISFYYVQTLNGREITMKNQVKELEKVTKNDVIEVARMMKLQLTYLLKQGGEK